MSGRLWAIVGATGTGKTALSLELAHARSREGRPAEIVNADAMQLYRGMDIGTAKLPAADRTGIPHFLFDMLEPSVEASVAQYQPAARATIQEIHARGHDAILVGGSGLYVSSVLYDFNFPPRDEALRAELERELLETGVASLFARLEQENPAMAASIDAKNGRRVVRALELSRLGESAPGSLPPAPKLWADNTRIIAVRTDRSVLVERLNLRVQQMWLDGLLEEVRELIPMGIENGKTASQAIGYAQALAQIHGIMSEAEAIEQTQALTRRYARRQVSWFKRYQQVEWINEPSASLITP